MEDFWSKDGKSMGQIQPTDCFCVACEQRIVLRLYTVGEEKSKEGYFMTQQKYVKFKFQGP